MRRTGRGARIVGGAAGAFEALFPFDRAGRPTGTRTSRELKRSWNAAARSGCRADPTVPDAQAIVEKLVEKARDRLGILLPPTCWRGRAMPGSPRFLDALVDNAELWLGPLLQGRRDLGWRGALTDAVLACSIGTAPKARPAGPARIRVACGHAPRDRLYRGRRAQRGSAGQALFGLERHPMVGDTPPPCSS